MLLTLLSGFIPYGRIVSATHGGWAGTPPGMAYGLGGLSAVLGAAVGMLVSGPAARRVAGIGQRAAQSGGPSTEEQAEMERLQRRMVVGSRLVAILLGLATAAMAVGRYL